MEESSKETCIKILAKALTNFIKEGNGIVVNMDNKSWLVQKENSIIRITKNLDASMKNGTIINTIDLNQRFLQ